MSSVVNEEQIVEKKVDLPVEESSTNLTNIIICGCIVVVLLILIYYAWVSFSNQDESFTKGLEQERDDPVANFNLREAIKELQQEQKKILRTLSENNY